MREMQSRQPGKIPYWYHEAPEPIICFQIVVVMPEIRSSQLAPTTKVPVCLSIVMSKYLHHLVK